MRRRLALALLAGLSGCGGDRGKPVPDGRVETLTVSAAASLQNALAPIATAYQRRHPRMKIEFNFGASGALAQQIANGAPVDVFVSAAPQPMNGLESRGLLLNGTRHNLLRNEVVLIAPPGSATPRSWADLADSQVKLIAIGDPASVPAGDYAKQVLSNLGLWDRVQSRLLLGKDVRQVLSYIETGNADAGIVYATDARQSARVRVAAVAPANTHAPVVYPVAALRGGRDPAAARALCTFLAGPEAGAIFTAQGFTVAE
jgi:molybdate transport system substrate-binding protein